MGTEERVHQGADLSLPLAGGEHQRLGAVEIPTGRILGQPAVRARTPTMVQNSEVEVGSAVEVSPESQGIQLALHALGNPPQWQLSANQLHHHRSLTKNRRPQP